MSGLSGLSDGAGSSDAAGLFDALGFPDAFGLLDALGLPDGLALPDGLGLEPSSTITLNVPIFFLELLIVGALVAPEFVLMFVTVS